MVCGKSMGVGNGGAVRHCLRPAGHTGRHGKSRACFTCGTPLTTQNSCPSVVSRGHGRCRGCQNAATKKYEDKTKRETLSHYGPNGVAKCSWEKCGVRDLDVLTLDHIKNGGAEDRRQNGYRTYRRLRGEGYPEGFQTLCHNHQWKKEILRRRIFPMGEKQCPLS
jgi:hypothetical protein